MLVSQLVSSSRRKGGSSPRWSRKKNRALGSRVSRTCGAARCANRARATRWSCQPRSSENVRIQATDRCQRSGDTSATRIDAEPSCRMMKSAPALRVTGTSAWGRARARTTAATASSRQSQNDSPPARAKRSRTGVVRPRRVARASRRRCASCHSQSRPRAAGSTSSHRYSGSWNWSAGSCVGGMVDPRAASVLPSRRRSAPPVLHAGDAREPRRQAGALDNSRTLGGR